MLLIWCVRAIFLLMVVSYILVGWFSESGWLSASQDGVANHGPLLAVGACLAVLVLGLTIDFLIPRKKLSALAGVFFGLVVGLLIGMALSKIVDLINISYDISKGSSIDMTILGIKGMLNVLCCYLGIIFVMQTKDDFRFIIPYVEFSKQTKGPVPYLLDTSVIIDGRIADIAATKIINSPMVIPRFILNELQMVADSADRLKRNRGRRGLDILNKMQTDKSLELSIEDIALNDREKNEPIDLQLISAAQKLNGKVVTNDFNLNKVAHLRGVDVININDLAAALKPIVLPGEGMVIKIVKAGDQIGQGVGYLDDGTMVVVENADKRVGKEIEISITSALQTSAGRMIFGKIMGEEE